MGKDNPLNIRVTLRDTHQDTLACVSFDRNIWVKFGFPMNQNTGVVDEDVMRNLSGPPYVFRADTLNLFDKKHPQGVTIHDVNVIFMHGGRRNSGKWMFSSIEDGYPVVETVRAVNEYLVEKGDQPISVVMACNKSDLEDGIKIGDFDAGENIVYAVGETVGIVSPQTNMREDGGIHFIARAHDFWGLDDLIQSQLIQQLKIIE